MNYEPAEDSYLLEEEVRKRARGKRVLDVGSGSGIQARAALRAGAKNVLATDIDNESLRLLKKMEIDCVISNLFDNVSGKFDLIVFNPPYLPEDEREDSESARVTTGGKRGDEIIVRFLRNVGKHLEDNGEILLVVSSLTPLGEIERVMKERGLVRKVVATKKVFMEELWVWEIRKL
jgi:release factor glutamine methyltransferase